MAEVVSTGVTLVVPKVEAIAFALLSKLVATATDALAVGVEKEAIEAATPLQVIPFFFIAALDFSVQGFRQVGVVCPNSLQLKHFFGASSVEEVEPVGGRLVYGAALARATLALPERTTPLPLSTGVPVDVALVRAYGDGWSCMPFPHHTREDVNIHAMQF